MSQDKRLEQRTITALPEADKDVMAEKAAKKREKMAAERVRLMLIPMRAHTHRSPSSSRQTLSCKHPRSCVKYRECEQEAAVLAKNGSEEENVIPPPQSPANAAPGGDVALSAADGAKILVRIWLLPLQFGGHGFGR